MTTVADNLATGRNPESTPTILYAEDDESYAFLFECTFKEGGFKQILRQVPNGAEAQAYLQGEGKYADRAQFPFPSVVLADLKMPRVSGFELLEWIRRHSVFPHLPVIVLTCSDEIKDVRKAYTLGANSFLVKPVQVNDLRETLKALEQYWMKHNVSEHQARPSARSSPFFDPSSSHP